MRGFVFKYIFNCVFSKLFILWNTSLLGISLQLIHAPFEIWFMWRQHWSQDDDFVLYSHSPLSILLLVKLSKVVSVARVIYLRLNEIECRLNSPRTDSSHNFTHRQANGQKTQRHHCKGMLSLSLSFLISSHGIWNYNASRQIGKVSLAFAICHGSVGICFFFWP